MCECGSSDFMTERNSKLNKSDYVNAMARYYGLLSALASDLDHKLSELCTTPPPPYDRLSDNELHTRESDHNIKHKIYGHNDRENGDVVGLRGIYTHRPSESQIGVDAEKTQRGNSHAQVSGKTQYETEDQNGRISIGGNVNKQWDKRGGSHTGYGWEVEGDWDF